MLQPPFHLPWLPPAPSWRTDSKGSLSVVRRAALLGKGAFIFVSRISHHITWLGRNGSLQRAQLLVLWTLGLEQLAGTWVRLSG